MKNRKLILALLFYPFGIFSVLGLMLSRRKKLVLATFAITAYLFAVTFIPASTNVEIQAEKWEYGYLGGLGIAGDYSKLVGDSDAFTETTTSTSPALSEGNYIAQNSNTTKPYTSGTKPTTTRLKTKTTKTVTKSSSRVTTSTAVTTTSKSVIYLSNESKVYSDWNLNTVHTDSGCQKLKGTVVIMTFKQAIEEQISYCSECADTVVYIPNNE